MKIKHLLEGLDIINLKNYQPDFNIKGVECDSRSVKNNYLFVAIRGNLQDGHKFISSAISKGARAVVMEDIKFFSSKNNTVTLILVKNSRRSLGQISANFYNHPSKKIKVIGITGTNGKTTVSFLLEKILQEAGFKVAVLGTINYRLNGELYNCINTTPDALTLQRYFKMMLRKKIDYAVIEVSSHALDQERVEGVNFSAAIFTNLTEEHLDYHKSLEDYFNTKSRLFKMLNNNSFAIINNDSPYAKRLVSLTQAKLLGFGFRNATLSPREVLLTKDKTRFYLDYNKQTTLIESSLIGKHNVYNILAAAACALSLGLDMQRIKKGIQRLKSVPGRLEMIKRDIPFKVFVDYAHTEDALQRVLLTIRKLYNKNRIICVFGCGGNRDKTKRPKMGRVASNFADYVVVTSDNPRNENPEDITSEICSGISKKNYEVILERREAIHKAICLADKDTVIVVAGKGHERYQIIKDERIPFDDRKVIKESTKAITNRRH